MMSQTAARAIDRYNALARGRGWRSTCYQGRDFANPNLVELLALWSGLAADEEVPRRRDFTPQRLRKHLSSIAIYERLTDERGGERFRVRVMGASFCAILGNLNGRYFDEAVPPQHLERWMAAPRAAIEARAPLRFVSRSEIVDKEFITGEYLLAPLIGDGEIADSVLAAGSFGPTAPARPGDAAG